MKSYSIRQKFVAISMLAMLHCAIGSVAHAEDPEADENNVEALPSPSLGGTTDDLPAPTQDIEGQDASRYQVNKIEDEDQVYLPAPEGGDFSPGAAPVTFTSNNYSSSQAEEWQMAAKQRPAFTLSAGVSSRNYATTLVPDRVVGANLGASYRFYDVAQTVFLHFFGGVSYFKLNDVGTFSNVKDVTYHLGPMIEVGVGRRFSIFGTLFHRRNVVEAGRQPNSTAVPDIRQLTNVNEEPGFKLGLGAQYDFYVIPHGSLGIRGYIEQDIMYVALAFAMEPVPRKRINLDYQEDAR